MTRDATADETLDEQLGSPAFTFEIGWLSGVLLGSLVVALIARRRRRRRGQRQRRQSTA